MPTPLYLNERSCGVGDPTPDEALAIALGFVATVRGVQKHSRAVLFLDRALKEVQVGSAQTLAQVLTSDEGDIESWRYLRALDNRTPFRLPTTGEALTDDVDYTYDGERAIGLGYAHAARGVGVSLLTTECWDCPEITVRRVIIESDEIVEAPVAVRHAARTDHLGTALRGMRRDQLAGRTVAVYALMPSLLQGVRDVLEATYDDVDVRCRDDYDGAEDSLALLARSADIFVVVTQKATHAAANIIIDERKKAGKSIAYPASASVAAVLEAITSELD